MKALRKYLATYAEPEQGLIENLPGQWSNVLIIPAYKELAAFFDFSQTARTAGNALLILVINRPQSDDDTDWANKLIEHLPKAKWANGNLSLHTYLDNDILLVDRAISGASLPSEQGVGLARKIAADIACKLITAGRITNPWIHSTDADTALPANYFNAQHQAPKASPAITLPFLHRPPTDGSDHWPHALYDWHMRYYVAGLSYAGSRYAHHSIGSCLAIHHEAYAKVRGFPKRSGGEDFYVLNKLAKLGVIYQAQEPVLEICSRFSDRVPFGTGPATKLIAEKTAEEFASYCPQVFDVLKELLDQIENNSNMLSTIAEEAALAIGLTQFKTKQPSASQQQTHQWFDAFRQLKCIHWLRDNHFPNQRIERIKTAASFNLPPLIY